MLPALLMSLLVYTCRLDGAFPRESLMYQELSLPAWDPSLGHTETAHALLPTEPPKTRSQRGGKPGQVTGRPDRASEWPPKSWPPRNMAEVRLPLPGPPSAALSSAHGADCRPQASVTCPAPSSSCSTLTTGNEELWSVAALGLVLVPAPGKQEMEMVFLGCQRPSQPAGQGQPCACRRVRVSVSEGCPGFCGN